VGVGVPPVTADREAQPDPRVEALREALELVVNEPWWRNWGAGASVALDAARAALATTVPPPAGIDVDPEP
jgi:hypothetical protein